MTKFSKKWKEIDQLMKDVKTKPNVKAVFETGSPDEKKKMLKDDYDLSSDDVNDIYNELARVVPEGKFWFW